MQTTLPVSALDVDARAAFITKTYAHLLIAIIGFIAIEVFFFQSGLAYPMAQAMLGVNWLLVLGGFMLVSWFATRAAHQATSTAAQYAALGATVLAQAVIFVPLLVMAEYYAPGAISSAGFVTLLGFGALTAIAFWTRKDFSFLGAALKWAGIVALLLIVGSVLFGFQLGTFFSVAMIAFAGGAILYDTSNILHHYPEDRYVGASVQLFASVALMFWYILQLFMSRD
ncbi:MAG: Bax inhibitor-1 family protein [Bacteroidota bacterium]